MVYITNENPKSYLVVFTDKLYPKQPNGNDMGRITNELKRKVSRNEYKPYSLEEILNKFSEGYVGTLCHATLDNNQLDYISTNIFAIDIDDDAMKTDPVKIFKKSRAAGLFYTASHGIKGNRYRLLYVLDKRIKDYNEFRSIVEIQMERLSDLGCTPDRGSTNPFQPIRGGLNKFKYLINEQNVLSYAELSNLAKSRAYERQKQFYDYSNSTSADIPFTELEEMAEIIGYIPSDGTSENRELWGKLVYGIKHHQMIGAITEDEGLRLFHIISGHEQSDKAYYRMNPRGKSANGSTIGSLISEAKKRGYKNKSPITFEFPIEKPKYEVERIKIDEFIPVEIAKEILTKNKGKRTLIDSPTGSAKTTAYIKVLKESDKGTNHFYIFAVPTIALVQQIESDHEILGIYGKNDKKLFKQLHKYVKADRKSVFACTYDMTPKLIELLNKYYTSDLQFTLIIDEYHKFVMDYSSSYRKDAIKKLRKVSEQAQTLIALSGTTNEIIKDEFDKVIYISNKNSGAKITEFVAYTYEEDKNAESELIKLIEVTVKHKKLIVFIQAKEKIKSIAKHLRKQGIKVQTLTADNKHSLPYKKIVEQQRIDDETQVLLTTSVIADGVSIINKNNPRFEILVVCTRFSKFFEPSLLKQMSNRLREHYDRFSIFLQEQKQKDAEKKFPVLQRYGAKKRTATRLSKVLNEDPYFDPYLFTKSVIEHRYALELNQYGQVDFDKLSLMHKAYEEQTNYYYGNRNSFADAVKSILQAKEIRTLNVSEEIRNKNLDLAYINLHLEQEQQEKQLEKDQQKKLLPTAYTKDVYKAFVKEDAEVLKVFKNQVSGEHYSHLAVVTQYTDFETSLHLARQVKKNSQIHAFVKDIRALCEVINMQSSTYRTNITKKVLESCLKLSEWLTTDEFNKAIEKIAKKLRLQNKDIKAVKGMLEIEEYRKNKERKKRVVGTISVKSISVKYKLSIDVLKNIIIKYAEKTGKKAYAQIVKSALNEW